MARPDGSASFEAAGVRHVLRFGINTLCEIEDRLGVSVTALGETMSAGLSMRQLRTIFAAGVSPSVTDAAAGDLIDEIGVQRAVQLVGAAMQAAFPAPEGGAADPRVAAAGTGSTS